MLRYQPLQYLQWIIFFITTAQLFQSSNGDVGTAAHYSPPYLPTECYGYDASQFPSSDLFAAAGDGIWDNGASCGRQYLVRCISAAEPGTCVPDSTIQIRIVDYALTAKSSPSAGGATMVLSDTAFDAIAKSSAASINIEFQHGIRAASLRHSFCDPVFYRMPQQNDDFVDIPLNMNAGSGSSQDSSAASNPMSLLMKLSSFNSFLNIILDDTNYATWGTLISSALTAIDLIDYVNGKKEMPPSETRATYGEKCQIQLTWSGG